MVKPRKRNINKIRQDNIVKNRNYALDLGRFICMFLIVMYHTIRHGMPLVNSKFVLLENPHIVNGISQFCQYKYFYFMNGITVSYFVIITGYGFYKNKMKWRHLSSLFWEVFFWSIIMGSILFGLKRCSLQAAILSFFPVISNTDYWFFVIYFALVIFLLFFDGSFNIGQRPAKMLIFILLMIAWFQNHHSIFNNGYQNVAYFILLVIIGMYERKHGDLFHFLSYLRKKLGWVGIFIFPMIFVGLDLFKRQFHIQFPPFMGFSLDLTYVLNTFQVIYFFEYMKHAKVNNEKLIAIIKKLTPAVFGIYLVSTYITRGINKRLIFLFHMNPWLGMGIFLLIVIFIFIISLVASYSRFILFNKFNLNQKLNDWVRNISYLVNKI